jgi:phosphatidylglycerophosphate synthase
VAQPPEEVRVRTSTISRIKQSYGTKESEDRTDSLVSRFLYRPVSFYLSIPFVGTGCSANQVTLLRIPVAVLGTVLIVTGTWANTLIGCSLYALCTLLDYVDGNIARLYGNANDRGAFLDALVHVFERSLLPISVAVGLCIRRDRLLTHYAVSAQCIFFVGLFGSITGFARTFLSLSNLKNQPFGTPVSSSQPSGRPSPVNSTQGYSTFVVLKYGKKLMRLLIRESAYFSDAVGIVVLAASDLLSVFLVFVAVHNMFVLRDEWGSLRRHPYPIAHHLE